MKSKMKTKKAFSRRLKVTPTGKVMRNSAFKRHLRRNKSRSQVRRLKKITELRGVYANKAKKILGK